jgi:LmbE family N-acetylglucosaminyl deacetylase
LTGVLAVIPHPDDELWFGGTLRVLAEAGRSIHLIAVTSGEAGTDYQPRDGERLRGEALARWREGELRESAGILGVDAVECWGLPDGRLEALEPEPIIARLVAAMRGVELVLTLGRDGIYGHRDHVAVTRWVAAAAAEVAVVAYGVVFEPGVFDTQWRSFAKRRPELAVAEWIDNGRGTRLGEEAWRVEIGHVEPHKRAAIRAHRSQLRGPDEAAFFVPGTLPLMLGVERFERLA